MWILAEYNIRAECTDPKTEEFYEEFDDAMDAMVEKLDPDTADPTFSYVYDKEFTFKHIIMVNRDHQAGWIIKNNILSAN